MQAKNPEETEESSPDTALYISIGALVVIILAIVLIPRFMVDSDEPKTIDELIEQTIREGETEDRKLYNGFVFIRQGNLWHSQVQEGNNLYQFATRFNPYDVEDVIIEGNVDDSFRTGRMYITFQPDDPELVHVSLAAAELSLNLVRAMDVEVIPACMNEHPDCVNTPILSCNTTSEPIIEIVNAEETKLIMDKNCMRIQGTEFELLKVVDRVIFTAYGIMK